MPDYVKKTISAYDQSPDKYVNSSKDMTPSAELNRFVKEVRAKGKSVLDAGCAFGRDSAAFAKEGLVPVGIDLSDELLKRARTVNSAIEFKKMDVRHLEFANGTFSGAWCNAVLLHLNDSDLIKALFELHRVLKSEGILFVSFKKGVGAKEVIEKFSSDSARFYNFKTKVAVEGLLKQTGFSNIDAYYVNERNIFGPDKRDLEWIHCFATKA